MADEHSSIEHAVFLCRVEPEGNVARSYALMIERDLFGRVVLVPIGAGSAAVVASGPMRTPARARPPLWATWQLRNTGADIRTSHERIGSQPRTA